METTYIIGHKHPDTDSIAAAMAYAQLKTLLGEKVCAGRLGTLNEETKFATRYFNIEAPAILTDARCTLNDIELDEAIMADKGLSCNQAYKLISNTKMKALCVTDNDKLVGMVTISDLAQVHLKSAEERCALLSKSNLKTICEDVKGTVLCDCDSYSSNGNVFVYNMDHNSGLYENSILVLNNDLHLIKCINDKPALVIYSGEKVDEVILSVFKEKNIPLICTKMLLESIVLVISDAVLLSEIMTKDLLCFKADQYIDEVSPTLTKTRYRSYPVLENGRVIGTVSRYHLHNYQKKQFILVDHSSYAQSIDNLDSAEVMEIIDHHHIGDVTTSIPIVYRNQPLGSSCSIIYGMYLENGLKPTKEIAGMMLSAIISDTLNFKSKTTTFIDKKVAEELSEIAEVDLNEYATLLLKASVNLKNGDINELIQSDLKQYEFYGYKLAVGQTNYDDISDVQSRMMELREYLTNYQKTTKVDLLIMMFTSVNAGSSLFLFYGPKKTIMADILDNIYDEDYGSDKKIMSRKQQLIPAISTILENE